MNRKRLSLSLLTLPVAAVYGTIMRLRNFFYERGWRKSFEFDFPIISVGNLSVGGTGKTPHIEYLINMCLRNNLKPSVLSRGYDRETYGYRMATIGDDARTIGDEPVLVKRKYPELTVVVCEKRAMAVPRLLAEGPDTDVILLDDAYQHRALKPGLNLLLTSFNRPFWKDKLLPAGRLREPWSEQKRADLLILTKCPDGLSSSAREGVMGKVNLGRDKSEVFFTGIGYGIPLHITASHQAVLGRGHDVLLLCGIADPVPLIDHLEGMVGRVNVMRFRDHHRFTRKDLRALRREFDAMQSSNKVIITTEKDATRLLLLEEDWDTWPLYVQPMSIHFLEGEERFEERVMSFVRSFPNDEALNTQDREIED
jgi:tetraacyldisaccharide 4'-kinase